MKAGFARLASAVPRRRVSPITRSGETGLPKRREANRATSVRWVSSEPCPARVAEVPTHWSPGASQASRRRRTSIATSAPCRPR